MNRGVGVRERDSERETERERGKGRRGYRNTCEMRGCDSMRMSNIRYAGIVAVGVVVAAVIAVDASAGNEAPAPFNFGWTPVAGGEDAAAPAPINNNFFNPQCVQKLFGLTTQCPSQTFGSMGDVSNHNLTRAEIEVILSSEEV